MSDNSHLTARARKTLSVPMLWLEGQGLLRGRMLDLGCGRGTDADLLGMEKYDPTWQPEKPQGKFDVVTCIYVTNTLPTRAARKQVEDDCLGWLQPTGTAYLAIRNDVKEEGWRGRKGRRTWQGNVKAGRGWKLILHRRFRIYERSPA